MTLKIIVNNNIQIGIFLYRNFSKFILIYNSTLASNIYNVKMNRTDKNILVVFISFLLAISVFYFLFYAKIYFGNYLELPSIHSCSYLYSVQ